MARPRVLADDTLLDAAAEELAEVGPEHFTLARAADRAGVSAATYIKRFDSKHGVLLALNHRWAGSLSRAMDEATRSLLGVDRLLAALMIGIPELENGRGAGRATNLLAVFARDLTDPELRKVLVQGWEAQYRYLVALLREPDVAEHLRSAPGPERTARILMAVLEGTRISWCVHPVESLSERVREDLTSVINAWEPRTRSVATQVSLAPGSPRHGRGSVRTSE